jgi:hypothetical protein
MAEAVGLSVASASIAAVQLVAGLQSISSVFFKSASVSHDFQVLQTRYEIELHRLNTCLQVLRPEGPNLPSIPMHVLEELYLELRKQAVTLELFQNEKSGSALPSKARWKPYKWTLKDKRRIEDFIRVLKRYNNILMNTIELSALTSTRTQHLSLQPEKSVSTPSFLPPCIDIPLVWHHPLSPRLASRSSEPQMSISISALSKNDFVALLLRSDSANLQIPVSSSSTAYKLGLWRRGPELACSGPATY